MSWYNTEIALQKKLTSLNLSQTIFFENLKEDSSVSAHIVSTNLPAETTALDKNLTDQYNGIYQVSIFDLTEKGKKDILETVDTILAAFKFGTRLVESGFNVFIEDSNPNPARVTGKYFVVDLSINYNAYIKR